MRSLHHAGYAVGTEAAAGFAAGGDFDVSELTTSEFWGSVQRFFGRKGWGTLRHEAAHPGVGLLTSDDWVEASAEETDSEGSCSFSTGFLAGLLSELAKRPVAVLEVTCRTRGDDACRFAFGSEAVVHELYGRLLDGSDLARALTEI
ncbi:MAG: 4-vinyl reductase [Gemmatimonadota bacterium]